MIFNFPLAWLLIIPLFLHLWYRPSTSHFRNVLRALLYLLIIFALSMPETRFPGNGGTIMVVVDRSRSMSENSLKEAEKIVGTIEKNRPAKSNLGVLSFGKESVVEKTTSSPGFDGFGAYLADRDSSNMASALENALMHIPSGESGRILLISDGIWTNVNPERMMAKAASRGIAVDYRELKRITANDIGFISFEGPVKVAPGEFFTLQCRIYSPRATTVDLRVTRNNSQTRTRKIDLASGETIFSWQDKADDEGILNYTIEIPADEADEMPENNRARKIIEIAGRKKILLLSSSPSGNLAKALENASIECVRLAPSPIHLTPEKLAGYSGVILENVRASELGMDGMELIRSLTHNGSLGLMMTGGGRSFAPGGYYRSPIEDVLPVTMEQRQELRKTSLALMVSLDRSGSMAMSAGRMTKMDLANLATIEAMRQLSPDDEFGVTAVDSSVHDIINLSLLGDSVVAKENKIRRIESMGGGIFTYTALLDAVNKLRKSKAGTRHLILFADAADAEEPGDYKRLIAQAVKEGITISAIGLGTPQDSDAVFLMDIAKRGGGQCYFTARPDELPRIFVEEIMTMTRSTFIEEKTNVVYTAAATLISGTKLTGNFSLGGYNLCFLKEGSQQLAVTLDEFNAPVAAVGNYGLGRSSAFTGEADGEYTGDFASDPTAGTLLAALASYMRVPDDHHKDFMITQRIDNGSMIITIHLDPSRKGDPWRTNPRLNTAVFRPGEKSSSLNGIFEWVTPDRMEGAIILEGDATYLSSVSWDKERPLQLAPGVLPYSPEYRPRTNNTDSTIRELIGITGGIERFKFDDIWNTLPSRLTKIRLTPYLFILAMIVFLCEISDRRFAWGRKLFKRRTVSTTIAADETEKSSNRRSKRRPKKHFKEKTNIPFDDKADDKNESSVHDDDTDTESDLSDAFKKAKRR